MSAVLLCVSARGAEADRFPPKAVRDSVMGCWDMGNGATTTFRPLGKHSVMAKSSFVDPPRGGPTSWDEQAPWTGGELEVSCQPKSQHGSFCRVSPTSGGLRVRVFAIRYNKPGVGHLVRDFVAQRCRP